MVLSLSEVVDVVEEPLSLLLHEMIVRIKRKRERMMSICLTCFPISGIGEPNIYHDLGVFYKKCGDFTWRVSDCEELVGEVNHTTECVTDLAKRISNCINYGLIFFPFTNFTMMFPFLSR